MPERSVPVTNQILSLITFLTVKVTYELKLLAYPLAFFLTGLTDFHKTLNACYTTLTSYVLLPAVSKYNMAGSRTCEVGAAGTYNILSTEVVSMKVLLM